MPECRSGSGAKGSRAAVEGAQGGVRCHRPAPNCRPSGPDGFASAVEGREIVAWEGAEVPDHGAWGRGNHRLASAHDGASARSSRQFSRAEAHPSCHGALRRHGGALRGSPPLREVLVPCTGGRRCGDGDGQVGAGASRCGFHRELSEGKGGKPQQGRQGGAARPVRGGRNWQHLLRRDTFQSAHSPRHAVQGTSRRGFGTGWHGRRGP